MTFPTLGQSSAFVSGSLSSEALANHPVQLVESRETRVITFLNDSEQRWVSRLPLMRATITYRGLNGYDMSLLMDFIRQVKGAYVDDALTNVFSITLKGVTYNFCALVNDAIDVQSEVGETFSCTLSVEQLRPN